MDFKKINELMNAAKRGDYSKLEEVKDMVSEEDYQKAVNLFEEYGQKSEEEIMQELKMLRQFVSNEQEIIERIQPFLNEEQKIKLQKVLETLDNE
ncbi:hypothetical protein RH915_00395 [Serpentinicella sp. ANB-PHB4]|uniref:hypothetical protein n=1 Tax=Serpentinicella sp. ANB-PHB4 TaxID=3074076 RepID=UPI002862526A|nr:hypothetical protein [Serpentinicella sp. ANB-PHB4]MDR5657939.1 hypothetical protein [Serpentinicella sp. ANB-PHB4]